jgi:hypothetical protein
VTHSVLGKVWTPPEQLIKNSFKSLYFYGHSSGHFANNYFPMQLKKLML